VTNANVFQLCQPGAFADLLTEILRNGAQALLAQAVEAEVAVLKQAVDGRQRLVRHGHLLRSGGLDVGRARLTLKRKASASERRTSKPGDDPGRAR
jgi:hypothetical protein